MLDTNSFEYRNSLSVVLALYVQCLMMDVITGFFNTGVIDSKLEEEIELSGQVADYAVKESYLNVISLASTMILNDQEQKR